MRGVAYMIGSAIPTRCNCNGCTPECSETQQHAFLKVTTLRAWSSLPCPSSLIHSHPRRLSGVRVYIDGEAHRPVEMRRPLPLLEVRAAEVSEGPFLAQGVFDPCGNSQRTTGSRAEAGTR